MDSLQHQRYYPPCEQFGLGTLWTVREESEAGQISTSWDVR